MTTGGRGEVVTLQTVNPGVVGSIPRRTVKYFGWEYKPRSDASVLYTRHQKET
jgi:hypothetical protein